MPDRIAKARWVSLSSSVVKLVWGSVSLVRLTTGEACHTLLVEAMEALETASHDSCIHIMRAVSLAASKVQPMQSIVSINLRHYVCSGTLYFFTKVSAS